MRCVEWGVVIRGPHGLRGVRCGACIEASMRRVIAGGVWCAMVHVWGGVRRVMVRACHVVVFVWCGVVCARAIMHVRCVQGGVWSFVAHLWRVVMCA